jgi:hypothetical protein
MGSESYRLIVWLGAQLVMRSLPQQGILLLPFTVLGMHAI